jgi:quinol monooxygenase YgiN
MSAPVVLYAEFTAHSDTLDEVERLITGLAHDVRLEAGNQEFAVYQRTDDPCRFLVFERYVDRPAFEAHLAAPYGAVFNAALGPLIVEDGSQLSFLDPTKPAPRV